MNLQKGNCCVKRVCLIFLETSPKPSKKKSYKQFILLQVIIRGESDYYP